MDRQAEMVALPASPLLFSLSLELSKNLIKGIQNFGARQLVFFSLLLSSRTPPLLNREAVPGAYLVSGSRDS